MDTALLIGEPSVLATGLLLIPMAVVLSIILPGNRVLPFVDLASLMFLLAMVTPFCKRNMFRMFITGTLIVTCILYVGDGHFARIHSGGGELAYSGAGRDGRDHQYRRRRHDACRLAGRQIWRVF